MVIAGRSIHLAKRFFFLGKLEQAVNQYFVHILLLVRKVDSKMHDNRIILFFHRQVNYGLYYTVVNDIYLLK